MNLPHPFDKARDLKPDTQGRIALVDAFGKVLTHLPLATAFDLSPERDPYSYEGSGYRSGDGYGSDAYGLTFPEGDGYASGDYVGGNDDGSGNGVWGHQSYGRGDLDGSGEGDQDDP